MRLLHINACVRENSRTNALANYMLSKYDNDIEQVTLNKEVPCALTAAALENRDNLIRKQEFDNPIFKFAKQFAKADIVVVAAPFWDLSFPALLKAYFENINVGGITFYYNEKGLPVTLCKARKLFYITTAGGYIFNNDFGFGYVKAISELFYGIKDIQCFKAEGLDITGNNPQAIIDKTKSEIAEKMKSDTDFHF